MSEEPKTYRGRSLDELIPKIRADLGRDAVVVRSSEGLSGGVGGFFQKQYVEVEARQPLPHEISDSMARNDRATTEGLSAPGVQALIEQAQPFAAQLAQAKADSTPFSATLARPAGAQAEDAMAVGAAGTTATGHRSALSPAAFQEDAFPAGAGLYGPQPNLAAITQAAQGTDFSNTGDAVAIGAAEPVDLAGSLPVCAAEAATPSRRVGSPAPVAAFAAAAEDFTRPAAADDIEDRLIAGGLTPSLAADVVGEVVDHVLPFSGPRQLPRLVRSALAQRIPVLTDFGPGTRTLAFVGAGGAGKTAAAANLAVAYAAAGRRVVAISLGDPAAGRDLAGRLEPLGIYVHFATSAREARERIARAKPLLAIVDTSAPSDAADAADLAGDLRELRPHEIHLALPATLSACAAGEAESAFRPVGVTHLAITHADATANPGAPIGLAIETGRPLSYVFTRATATPADPVSLAERLLP